MTRSAATTQRSRRFAASIPPQVARHDRCRLGGGRRWQARLVWDDHVRYDEEAWSQRIVWDDRAPVACRRGGQPSSPDTIARSYRDVRPVPTTPPHIYAADRPDPDALLPNMSH